MLRTVFPRGINVKFAIRFMSLAGKAGKQSIPFRQRTERYLQADVQWSWTTEYILYFEVYRYIYFVCEC